MNIIEDITDQYKCLKQWRPADPDEVELCSDWLETQDPEYWSGVTAGSMKGAMDTHVRTSSLMVALILADWEVEADDRYLSVC